MKSLSTDELRPKRKEGLLIKKTLSTASAPTGFNRRKEVLLIKLIYLANQGGLASVELESRQRLESMNPVGNWIWERRSPKLRTATDSRDPITQLG